MKKPIFLLLIAALLIGYSALYSETTAQPPSNYNEANAGTEANPFLIHNLANLRWLSENQEYWGEKLTDNHRTFYDKSGYYFIQTADIDASETQFWNDGNGFSPIGEWGYYEDNYPKYFVGIYNGNLFKISNLHITPPAMYESTVLGLFGVVRYSEFRNIVVDNIRILNSNGPTGGLVGMLSGGNIVINCSTSGNIIALNGEEQNMLHIGGLAGYMGLGMNGGIYQSYSTMNITVSGSPFSVGGLVGRLIHINRIYDSFFLGEINDLSGTAEIGGLTNNIDSRDYTEIRNSYVASKNINTNSGGITYEYYTSGSINSVQNCFWDILTTKTTVPFISNPQNIAMSSAHGLFTKSMKTVSTYTAKGWDFDEVWAINQDFNGGYPFLRAMHPDIPHIPYEPDDDIIEPNEEMPSNYYESGAGTISNPFKISNIANLKWMSDKYSQWWQGLNTLVYFVQTEDIDAYDTINWNNGQGFIPISRFVGVFDGNNKKILNLYINIEDEANDFNVGLFSYVTNNSVIKNLNLIDFQITASNTKIGYDANVGAVAGYIHASTIINTRATGVLNASSMGMTLAGGIVGIASSSTITNNSANVNIESVNSSWAFAAGIAGELYNSNLTNSYANGNILAIDSQHTFASGIAANVENSTIANSYAIGSFIATGTNRAFAAGIGAQIMSSSTISYSYSSGHIHAFAPNIFSGGIAGIAVNGTQVQFSFWNLDTTGQAHATSNGTPSTNYGLNTFEMKSSVNYINNGWDFVNIWDIQPDINSGYPHLKNNYFENNVPKPVDLIASQVQRTVELSWQKPLTEPISYNIYKDGNLLTTTSELIFIDNGVMNDKYYTYGVTSNYQSGESEPAEITIYVLYFTPPNNLSAEFNVDNVTLQWEEPDPITSEKRIAFVVYRDDEPLAPIVRSDGFNFYDFHFEYNVEYTYYVKAIYECETEQESPPSNSVVIFIDDPTDIGDGTVIPTKTELYRNFPNPFNPETTIRFSVINSGNVSIQIYNLRGQKIKTLLENNMDAGVHSVVWDGTDDSGRTVGSGVYFYQMQTTDFTDTKRMLLLK